MYRSNTYVQTGDGNSLSSGGSFFTLNLTSVNSGDYDTVEASYPGPGSPVALGSISPTLFAYQTPTLPTQADMDAAFPLGTYQLSATSIGGTDTTSFEYSGDHYAETLPYLSGTSYSALQNMNPFANQMVDFSPDAFDPASSFAYIFFTVHDNATNSIVFDAGFLPATTTSETIPAGTLLPGGSYTYEVIFSDRIDVPSPGATFEAEIGYDLRTTGTFATAPEPAGWLSACIGLLVVALWRRYRVAR